MGPDLMTIHPTPNNQVKEPIVAKNLTVSERTRWLLKERGWSQNQLAKSAGVSPQTVANTVTNGRAPQNKTQGKFARALGVPKSVFNEKVEMTEAELGKLAAAGTPRPAPVAKKAAAKKATAKKPAARKPAARKATATKPAAKKATARASAAKKPAGRTARTGAARKSSGRSGGPTVAEQVYTEVSTLVGKGMAVKDAVAQVARTRGITAGTAQNQYYRWKREAEKGARNIVRHVKPKAGAATGAARGRATARGRGGRGAAGGAVDFDLDAVIARLEKLRASRNEQVAVEACKALLSLR